MRCEKRARRASITDRGSSRAGAAAKRRRPPPSGSRDRSNPRHTGSSGAHNADIAADVDRLLSGVARLRRALAQRALDPAQAERTVRLKEGGVSEYVNTDSRSGLINPRRTAGAG